MAGPERRQRVLMALASVSGGSAVATVESPAGTVLVRQVVTPQAPLNLSHPEGLQTPPNADVLLVLTAAGAGNVGNVNLVTTPE